jgi:hypothetical protein
MNPSQSHTAYVVPAVTEIAGQCRIYVREGIIKDPRSDYKETPDAWKFVGLMNSGGELVCCDPIGDLVQCLKDCEPLMGGLQVRVCAEPEMSYSDPSP